MRDNKTGGGEGRSIGREWVKGEEGLSDEDWRGGEERRTRMVGLSQG